MAADESVPAWPFPIGTLMDGPSEAEKRYLRRHAEILDKMEYVLLRLGPSMPKNLAAIMRKLIQELPGCCPKSQREDAEKTTVYLLYQLDKGDYRMAASGFHTWAKLQRQAAYTGERGELVQPVEVTLRPDSALARLAQAMEKLELRAQRAADAAERKPKTPGKSRRKRQALDLRPLTEKQAEAVHIVGECGGNIAAAAKRLGHNRKTVKQHYEAAMSKMGRKVVKKFTRQDKPENWRQLPAAKRHGTRQLPADRRRQIAVSEDHRRS